MTKAEDYWDYCINNHDDQVVKHVLRTCFHPARAVRFDLRATCLWSGICCFLAAFWFLAISLFITTKTEGFQALTIVDTSRAVIHHTATSCSTTIDSIRRYHINERGWDDIGYHKIIDCEGIIHEGRPLTMQGAHAKGRNNLVGIALVGYDEFTGLQVEALKRLLEQLKTKRVERHHEECPGKGLDIHSII